MHFSSIYYFPFGANVVIEIIALAALFLISAMLSGSEAAFFSLKPNDLKEIDDSKLKNDKRVVQLLKKPEKLLATIMVVNTFANITIIILFTYISAEIIDFSKTPFWGFIIEVLVITFLILFVSEIIPKIFSTEHNKKVAKFMAGPLMLLTMLASPFTSVLLRSTSLFKKRLGDIKQNLSIDDLSNALELTGESLQEEKNILKGIVNFGNTIVSEIMHSRLDIVGIDINAPMGKLLSVAVESGYSRLPVYEGTPDNIKGILLTKDLLPYLNENNSFHWQALIKPAYFVPETKKIDDLLAEFQKQKIHLAIVVDEYGGTCGLVTMEDILEEVIGEISDESDSEEELLYKKLSQNVFIFEAKVKLKDFFKITESDEGAFDELEGEFETLAGLILELKGEIPQKGEKVEYKNFTFYIEAVDKRRIKLLKVIIK